MNTQDITLDNGLRVVLRPVQGAPVISFWVAYKIGSRNEPAGLTGVSHWVEHMVFKGTERFEAGELDRLIDRTGGTWNAFTSTDTTMYYETLPAHEIEIALAAESDRMANALFDPQEVESERTVIISERHGSENSPLFWLSEAMRKEAFTTHGYGHTILGDLYDLHHMQRDDLYDHYRRHYTPSNAVIVVVGAFDPHTMLEQIQHYFGEIEGYPAPMLYNPAEPEQQGEKRVMVERPGHTAFVSVAHHVPDAMQDDWFKLEVLDNILTGAGNGLGTRTTRLYQALIQTGIVAGIGGGMQETLDPFLYEITLTLNDGIEHAHAEAILMEELQRVQQKGITEEELQRAIKQARASFAYEAESVTDQAYWIAQSVMLGDVTWYDRFLERLEQVTLADVQDVAQRYFTPERRIVGWLLPTGYDEDESDEYSDDVEEVAV